MLYSLEYEEFKSRQRLSSKQKQILHTIHELFCIEKETVNLHAGYVSPFSTRFIDLLKFEEKNSSVRTEIERAISLKI